MNKMTKISLVVLLACIVAFSAVSVVFADTIFTDNNGFSYTLLYSDYASICGWEGDSDTLRIPLKVNDSYVKEVSSWAFSGRDDISGVEFYRADYLNVIGMMAFSDCKGLTGDINIPAQVSSIGLSAFQGCSNIDTLYYNTAANIPDQCFYLCTSLETVYLTDGVSNIGRLAFAGCDRLSYIRIPETVEYINPIAFNNCPNLAIYCYTDSYAQQYAEEKGIVYVLIDAPEPTEPPTEPPTDPPTELPTEPPTEPETDAPTEEPTVPETVEPTQPVTEPKGYYLGDVDGDNIVSTVDVTQIQRLLAKLVYDESCVFEHGDVDGDGGTTVMDATLIQRFLGNLFVQYDINKFITE